MGQRITTMTSGQARFPIAPTMFNVTFMFFPWATWIVF